METAVMSIISDGFHVCSAQPFSDDSQSSAWDGYAAISVPG
jgi:hypothetical protein